MLARDALEYLGTKEQMRSQRATSYRCPTTIQHKAYHARCGALQRTWRAAPRGLAVPVGRGVQQAVCVEQLTRLQQVGEALLQGGQRGVQRGAERGAERGVQRVVQRRESWDRAWHAARHGARHGA